MTSHGQPEGRLEGQNKTYLSQRLSFSITPWKSWKVCVAPTRLVSQEIPSLTQRLSVVAVPQPASHLGVLPASSRVVVPGSSALNWSPAASHFPPNRGHPFAFPWAPQLPAGRSRNGSNPLCAVRQQIHISLGSVWAVGKVPTSRKWYHLQLKCFLQELSPF